MRGYKLLHICGRMRSMYLGTEFHRYWAECGGALIHPRDQSYFENDKTKQCKEDCDFVTSDYGPWPFDGPMETAKIVVCYANPAYSVEDKKHQELISKQRTGVEPLPRPWHKFYKTRIADPLGKSVECWSLKWRFLMCVHIHQSPCLTEQSGSRQGFQVCGPLRNI